MSRGMTTTVDDQAFAELFAQERTFTTESLDEAEKVLAQDFVYERPEIHHEQILVDADMRMRFGGQRYWATQKAVVDLCGLVKLPATLLQMWPPDLTAYVLGQLSKRPQKTIIPVVRNDIVVAFVDPAKYGGSTSPPQYRPVANSTILSVCKSFWKGGERVEVSLSDRGMTVSFIGGELSVAPKVGDVTRLGIQVTASETGGPYPVARGYTLRLACTNGMVLSNEFGAARFSTDPRVKEETRLERWARELSDLGPKMDVHLLGAAYEKMAREPMLDMTWRDLYRNVTNAYKRGVLRAPRAEKNEPTVADRALGVSVDQRKAVVDALRTREREALQAHRAAEPQPTPWDAYTVMNNLTATAREETPVRRQALEELAGTLVRDYSAFALAN